MAFASDSAKIQKRTDFPAGFNAVCLVSSISPPERSRLTTLAQAHGLEVSISGGLPQLMDRLMFLRVPQIGNGANPVNLDGSARAAPSPEGPPAPSKPRGNHPNRGTSMPNDTSPTAQELKDRMNDFIKTNFNKDAESPYAEADRVAKLGNSKGVTNSRGLKLKQSAVYQAHIAMNGSSKPAGNSSPRRTSRRTTDRQTAKHARNGNYAGKLMSLLKGLVAADKTHAASQRATIREFARTAKGLVKDNARLQKDNARMSALKADLDSLREAFANVGKN
ncbi:MAG TPA: hypothetical protein VGQ87_03615 [Patescibacteria group bacterium]|nr:hypothetical protein [Patescibacteria group bacterium]